MIFLNICGNKTTYVLSLGCSQDEKIIETWVMFIATAVSLSQFPLISKPHQFGGFSTL